MIRVLALIPVLLLAGCLVVDDRPPLQIAGVGQVSLSFLPVFDVPDDVEDALDEAFDDEAFIRGIDFDPSVGGTVGISSYVSVVASGSGTLVIYVFDFADRAGNRLLRVGGQMSSPKSPDNPWEVLDYDLARDIAEEVLGEFEDWLEQNGVRV